jgi:two-component system, chemotaxis family, CheB/CheR fusion protein
MHVPPAETTTHPRLPYHVVGIGASAGGLDALERFVTHIPPDTGFAFVIVQHLSPDYKSMMAELLGRHTTMTVRVIEDGMTPDPNTVSLIPPRVNLTLQDGVFRLADKPHPPTLNLPIDIFFRSLAKECGERAVGVILSGTGSDGTRGVRAIREAGGLVLVQSPGTAQFDGMARSALSIGGATWSPRRRSFPPAWWGWRTATPPR